MMQESSTELRYVFRIGGAAAIVGAILGGVGNLVHPVTPLNDPVGVARVIADSEIWAPVHLAIVFGIMLMLGLVLVILDVAARQLAQEWASAAPDEKATALGLVHLNETVNFALASLFNFAFAAATFMLFGLAVALSDVYPRWLGWVAFVAGLASFGAGLIQALVGEPTDASRILTIFGPTVITLWLLIMGILLLRRRRSHPAGGAAGPHWGGVVTLR
jgi:hypothetical protein